MAFLKPAQAAGSNKLLLSRLKSAWCGQLSRAGRGLTWLDWDWTEFCLSYFLGNPGIEKVVPLRRIRRRFFLKVHLQTKKKWH